MCVLINHIYIYIRLIRRNRQLHDTGKYSIQSLSSSLLSTYPYKIKSLWFNSFLENIFSSISLFASSQT